MHPTFNIININYSLNLNHNLFISFHILLFPLMNQISFFYILSVLIHVYNFNFHELCLCLQSMNFILIQTQIFHGHDNFCASCWALIYLNQFRLSLGRLAKEVFYLILSLRGQVREYGLIQQDLKGGWPSQDKGEVRWPDQDKVGLLYPFPRLANHAQ